MPALPNKGQSEDGRLCSGAGDSAWRYCEGPGHVLLETREYLIGKPDLISVMCLEVKPEMSSIHITGL